MWAWRLAACYPHKELVAPAAAVWPHVAVILPVRGADPSLLDCLHGLIAQDYPEYEVYLVLDSAGDPAWDVLNPWLTEEQSAKVHVRVLGTKYETCSLKVSGTAQVIDELADSVQVVVLLDGDVIPYPHWLRDLVRPFHDAAIGATTGIRWYQPASAEWGSLVRFLWNAAAVTQMNAFRIPWAGSLAVRAELFRTTDLLERWKHCFCEDTVTFDILRDSGLQVSFVPAATMVNPESIALASCFSFIRRQMLTVRLHHSRWPFVRALGLGSGFTLLLTFAVFVTNAVVGDWLSAVLLGRLAGYVVGMGSALLWIERGLRQTAHQRGQAFPSSSWKTVLAALFTQVVYVAALVSVSFLRKVEWRGITYELFGATPVRLVEYRPYRAETLSADRTASLV